MENRPFRLHSPSRWDLPSRETWVLYLATLVMGSCGIAYEFTLSKVASDLLGHSVRQWSVIIGLMMLMMGVGADMQRYFADARLFDKFVGFEILLGLAGGLGPLVLLFAYGFDPTHYVLYQYATVVLIGLLIGFEIPILARLNEMYTKELKVNIGGILKMDYVGAFLGAIAWTFLLTRWFSITASALLLGVLNLGVAVFTLFFFRRLAGYPRALGSAAIASTLLLVYGMSRADAWTVYAEQRLYRSRIVLSATTDYQHIVLTRSRSGRVECFINGNLQFASSDEFIYHENLVHPAMRVAPRRERVLILGGGDGLALREVLKYPDVRSVVLCDIDPGMTRLASEDEAFVKLNRNSLKDARVTVLRDHALVGDAGRWKVYEASKAYRQSRVVQKVAEVRVLNLDAAKFVEQFDGFFDVIIADFPDPNRIELAKLYSVSFYHHVREKLARQGVFVQQSTSSFFSKEAFLCIGRTMHASGLAAVPFHDNVPSFGEWGWWIARKDLAAPALRDRLRAPGDLTVPTRYLTPELIRTSLLFGKGQLESQFDDVNTLTSNTVYHHYLRGWETAFQ